MEMTESQLMPSSNTMFTLNDFTHPLFSFIFFHMVRLNLFSLVKTSVQYALLTSVYRVELIPFITITWLP